MGNKVANWWIEVDKRKEDIKTRVKEGREWQIKADWKDSLCGCVDSAPDWTNFELFAVVIDYWD